MPDASSDDGSSFSGGSDNSSIMVPPLSQQNQPPVALEQWAPGEDYDTTASVPAKGHGGAYAAM